MNIELIILLLLLLLIIITIIVTSINNKKKEKFLQSNETIKELKQLNSQYIFYEPEDNRLIQNAKNFFNYHPYNGGNLSERLYFNSFYIFDQVGQATYDNYLRGFHSGTIFRESYYEFKKKKDLSNYKVFFYEKNTNSQKYYYGFDIENHLIKHEIQPNLDFFRNLIITHNKNIVIYNKYLEEVNTIKKSVTLSKTELNLFNEQILIPWIYPGIIFHLTYKTQNNNFMIKSFYFKYTALLELINLAEKNQLIKTKRNYESYPHFFEKNTKIKNNDKKKTDRRSFY